MKPLLLLFALCAAVVANDPAPIAPAEVPGLREQWLEYLGGFPLEKVPLAARWLGEIEELPAFTRRKVAYTIEPGVETDAVLLLPKNARGTLPGVVVFHPTLRAHYAQAAGYDVSAPEKMMGPQLAELGFAVLCPRCFIFGDGADYAAHVARMKERHPAWRGITRMTWDGIRALDYLASLNAVDAGRLGVLGHSLGAKEVLYVAAFDSRVKAAVFSEGGIGRTMSNWEAVWYLGEAAAGSPREHHELLALIAPRAFLLIAGGGKDGADGEASARFLDAVRPLFGPPSDVPAKKDGALRFVLHGAGHAYPSAAREAAGAFLREHLRAE
jgi:dienelactone hydrolase